MAIKPVHVMEMLTRSIRQFQFAALGIVLLNGPDPPSVTSAPTANQRRVAVFRRRERDCRRRPAVRRAKQ